MVKTRQWHKPSSIMTKRLHRLLQRCRARNLKLNREKVRLRLTEVKFVGHRITSEGLKLDQGSSCNTGDAHPYRCSRNATLHGN